MRDKVILPLSLSTISLFILTACGGGSGGTEEATQDSSSVTYTGSFVVPQTVQTNSLRILTGGLFSSYSAACPNVPDGYEPMANATVSIEKSDGTALTETTTTDNCGVFTIDVSQDEDLTDGVISAALTGFKTLKANANNFKANASSNNPAPVASTIPSSASYVISAIQKADADQLSFSVTDTSTNNAVIQLSKSAFEVFVNDQPIQITTLNSADQLDVASSNTLTLDASGSMSSTIYDTNGAPVQDDQGRNYDRFRITSKAAHQFISEKAASDEVAVIPFSHTVDLIKNDYLTNTLSLQDSSGAVNYDYSDDGFTSDLAKLHFAVDLYNPFSGMWVGRELIDGIHASRTDSVTSAGVYYRWNSGTELQNAINTSITEVSARSNAIKRVFVMTDGDSYFSNRAGVIQAANDNNVVVHAVAVSAQANETDLKEIANQTGGSYHKIIDAQTITGIYSSLQTTVKYAYVADLASPLQSGDSIKLVLTVNGETVERLLTVQ